MISFSVPPAPKFGVSNKLWPGNKKGMGVSTSAHPRLQALALPHSKDKQRSQPTPSDYMQGQHLIIRYAEI